MRRIWILLLALTIMSLAGCESNINVQNEESLVQEEFMVNSLGWGHSWKEIKKEYKFKKYNVQRADEYQTIVEIEKFEYLGFEGSLTLTFSEKESNYPMLGLEQVSFLYDNKLEEEFIKKIEEHFAEYEKDSISTKWNSPETLGSCLSEAEKQEYLESLQYTQNTDELLNNPLVRVNVRTENDRIYFHGNEAAIVANLRK